MGTSTFLTNETYACEIYKIAHKEGEHGPVAGLSCQCGDEL